MATITLRGWPWDYNELRRLRRIVKQARKHAWSVYQTIKNARPRLPRRSAEAIRSKLGRFGIGRCGIGRM